MLIAFIHWLITTASTVHIPPIDLLMQDIPLITVDSILGATFQYVPGHAFEHINSTHFDSGASFQLQVTYVYKFAPFCGGEVEWAVFHTILCRGSVGRTWPKHQASTDVLKGQGLSIKINKQTQAINSIIMAVRPSWRLSRPESLSPTFLHPLPST